MDELNHNIPMLDLMLRPALCVEDGRIVHINPAAGKYLLSPGMTIGPMIASGAQEYGDFSEGCLFLTLQIGDRSIGASVMRMQGQDVLILEEPQDQSELQALALAATQLREPLAGILAITDKLDDQPQMAQLNRRMFQMMRLITNMSDAHRYACSDTGRMEYVQISSFFEELFLRAGQLLASAELKLEYWGLREAVYTLADPERLERAAYNLLSNSAKFAPKGSTIQVRLTHKGNRLYLSVADEGPGIDSHIQGSLYSRFLREPALEDDRYGLGLGMVLVRSTAAIHGGAVLVDRPENLGNRTTMTLQIRSSRQALVRSPVFRMDYAGEWDHALLELSDCLPAELYI